MDTVAEDDRTSDATYRYPRPVSDVTDGTGDCDDVDGVNAVSALGEPSRRALYDHITRAGGWVSRDQAAEATGLERGTVAHHLDRLATDGLLEIDYQRLSGRSGPGAGRPAKLYRRSQRTIAVSLPPRDYRLPGALLARAIERTERDGTDITASVRSEATAEGQRWGADIDSGLRGAARRRKSSRRQALVDALDEHGFEPNVADDGVVSLRNCPFHHLSAEHAELVCGLNHCLLAAANEQLGGTGLVPLLEPTPGECCVRFRPEQSDGR